MQTASTYLPASHATIWHDKSTEMYFVYSPQDGIHHAIELYVGSWGSSLWRKSQYATPDEIDEDASYYEVIQDANLRKNVLAAAINGYAKAMAGE